MATHFAPLSDRRFPLSADVERGYLPPHNPATQQQPFATHLEPSHAQYDRWENHTAQLSWSSSPHAQRGQTAYNNASISIKRQPYSPLRHECLLPGLATQNYYQQQRPPLRGQQPFEATTIVASPPSIIGPRPTASYALNHFASSSEASPSPRPASGQSSRSFDAPTSSESPFIMPRGPASGTPEVSRSKSTDSSSVKIEQDDGNDYFIMEFCGSSDADSRDEGHIEEEGSGEGEGEFKLGSGRSGAKQPCRLSSGKFPRPFSTGHHVDIRTEVPIRAGSAPEEMKKLMHILRLDPFTMHNGVDRGIVAPSRPEPGPLTEEPIMFEFQLEIHGSDDENEDDIDGVPGLPTGIKLRAFSPDFELDDALGECDTEEKWVDSRDMSSSTTQSDHNVPRTPPPSAKWDFSYPLREVRSPMGARMIKANSNPQVDSQVFSRAGYEGVSGLSASTRPSTYDDHHHRMSQYNRIHQASTSYSQASDVTSPDSYRSTTCAASSTPSSTTSFTSTSTLASPYAFSSVTGSSSSPNFRHQPRVPSEYLPVDQSSPPGSTWSQENTNYAAHSSSANSSAYADAISSLPSSLFSICA
ncbi:hypothetical protein ONZ45_g7853 [Pleurotus djamor]|nr:hypothetical protein ONZ45_g7853 [Pleurotus djamor]